ncbi:MAG: hypothetical protein DYH14_04770 [Betaproteobacteria bacterium PRO3]|nr:hypothetical protein [Betaproteobacteria bacterium PRO3]
MPGCRAAPAYRPAGRPIFTGATSMDRRPFRAIFTGTSHTEPIFFAPSMRPAMHSCRTRASVTPRIFAASMELTI